MTSGEEAGLPAIQDLNSAVIRLMAKCARGASADEVRTLVGLLRELRAHPDLSRDPAVLAGLAEAHAIWVRLLATIVESGGCDPFTTDDVVLH